MIEITKTGFFTRKMTKEIGYDKYLDTNDTESLCYLVSEIKPMLKLFIDNVFAEVKTNDKKCDTTIIYLPPKEDRNAVLTKQQKINEKQTILQHMSLTKDEVLFLIDELRDDYKQFYSVK